MRFYQKENKMKKRIIFLSAVSCFIFLTQARAAVNNGKVAPKYSIEQVIADSKEYAVQRGRSLKEYFIDRVDYDASKEEWAIFFQGNMPTPPGVHFLVWIDEKTGEKKLAMGQ